MAEEFNIDEPDPIEPGDAYTVRSAIRILKRMKKLVAPMEAQLRDRLLVNAMDEFNDGSSLTYAAAMADLLDRELGFAIEQFEEGAKD
jgi:hypothetical protein